MSKVYLEDSVLTDIADAIREKTGGSGTITPANMPDEIESISGGGDPVIESKTITANGTYTAPEGVDGYSPVVVNVPTSVPWKNITGSLHEIFSMSYFGRFLDYITYIINTIESITDITDIGGMFYGCTFSTYSLTIPAPINLRPNSTITFDNQFMLPINVGKVNMTIVSNNNILGRNNQSIPLGSNVNGIVEYPEDLFKIPLNTNFYGLSAHALKSLLSFPTDWVQTAFDNCTNNNNTIVTNCYTSNFDEFHSIKDIKIPVMTHSKEIPNYNSFNSMGKDFYNVRHFRFNTHLNGDPYIVRWGRLTLNLTRRVGYGSIPDYLSRWGSIYGTSYMINDNSSYELYKNEPTAWASVSNYSFYNHDSAVETINSLPDASAYLIESGESANVIQFEGASGSATDGGAINTLTAEEIAVATAKGWTVTLI